MRGVAMFVALAALAVAVTSAGGASAAFRPAKGELLSAAFPTWSPDGRQIAFFYTKNDYSKGASYRIVRTSSRLGGKLHSVFAARGYCCNALQWEPGGRLLLNAAGGLKTVPAEGGKPKQIAFLSCGIGRHSWGVGCYTAGLVMSPNRRYAAVGTTSNPFGNGIYEPGLVQLSPGRHPLVLSPPLPAEEDAGGFADTALTFSPDGRSSSSGAPARTDGTQVQLP